MILLTSLELAFLKLNVEFNDLFFVLSILGCLSCELTIARIGSAFCKFEEKRSMAGIFKLDTVFAKKSLKVEQSSSSFERHSPFK